MTALIRFFNEVGKLKFIKRMGWILGGVKESETESIADHSFRLALMSWYFADKKGLDVGKVIKMSLVHDLCTIYSGDLTPYDNLVTGDFKHDKAILAKWPRRAKEEKERMVREQREKEEVSFNKLLANLPEKFAQEIRGLWLDYESGETKEGRFLAQIDRVEKLMQATEYRANDKYLTEIDPFWIQLKELVDDPDLIHFIEAMDKDFYQTGQNESQATSTKTAH